MRRCRIYRYRLQPTVSQRGRLEQLLRNQCELYNAALEERRGAWSWERRRRLGPSNLRSSNG